MKQLTALFVFGICVIGGTAQANTFVKAINLGPQHTRPESIVKAWGGKYYVSIQNTGDAVATDGEIVQVDLATGAVTGFVPQGTLRNPRGLAFTGEFLVATDTDKVWKISQGGAVTPLTTSFPFPPVFFNDAAPETGGKAVFISEMGPGRNVQRDPAGFLWPTDSFQAEAIPTAARVYRITLDGNVTNVFTPTRKILVTNGITERKKHGGQDGQGESEGHDHLLALDFFHGSVVDVDVKKDTKSIIATGPFRGCDGLEQAKDGTIFVTSFENGRVWRMDRNGENVVKLLDVATDLGAVARQTLADLALDEAAGLLYVPDTLHSQIIVMKTQ
jgi:sugar lactone lactonase YvrE